MIKFKKKITKNNIIRLILFFSIYFYYQIHKKTKVLHSKISHIVVGINFNNYPYSFYDKNKKLIGFDIDLLEILAKELFISYKIIELPSWALHKELVNNNINCVSQSIFYEENKTKILYTNAYISHKHYFLSNFKKKYELLSDLNNIQIGCLNTCNFIHTNDFNLRMICVDSICELIELFKEDKIEGFFVNEYQKNYINKLYPTIALYENNIIDMPICYFGYGLSYYYLELINSIDKIIINIKRNGKLKELMKKWKLD